jgi:large conductance mechanosensitive channel
MVAVQPGNVGPGLGWQLVKGGDDGTFLNLGAAVYFLIVLPYKAVMARQGRVVFGDSPPTKTCPACLSDELGPAAT